jgi:hypothetical protein
MQTSQTLDKKAQHGEYQIEIFESGSHLSGNHISRDYSQKDLQEVVDSYDPTYFKAPLIFNYYAEDPHNPMGYSDRELVKSPFAFGYPEKLSLNGSRLVAHFEKIAPEFVEMAKEHKILSVSASFYPENNPFNPTPGKLSLRHVAGLGSEPPAVKGMPLEFSEGSDFLSFSNFAEHSYDPCEEETLDYNCACDQLDLSFSPLVNLMNHQRELLIERVGIEEADKYLPRILIDSISANLSDKEEDSEAEETSEMNGGYSDAEETSEMNGGYSDAEETSEMNEDDSVSSEMNTSVVADVYSILVDHTEKVSGISNGLKYSMNQIIGIKGGLNTLNSDFESLIDTIDQSFTELSSRVNSLVELISNHFPAAKNLINVEDSQADYSSPDINENFHVGYPPNYSETLGYSEKMTTQNEELESTVAALKMERDQEKRKNYVSGLMNFMEVQCNQHHRILPAQLEQEKAFALSLLESQEKDTVEFSENTVLPLIEQFKQNISNRNQVWTPEPSVVIDNEDVVPRNYSESELSVKARQLKDQYKKKGKMISLHEAIDMVAGGEMPESEE